MNFAVRLFACLLLMVLVSACGRRGALEPPPASQTAIDVTDTTTGRKTQAAPTVQPQETQRGPVLEPTFSDSSSNSGDQPSTFDSRSSWDGKERPDAPKMKGKKRGFVLDDLL